MSPREKLADALMEVDLRTLDFERMKQERDEAREDLDHWKIEYEIVVSRLCGIKHERDNGIIAENEVIPVLRKERDEAREKYATEATEHMLAINKLCNERDKALEALMKIEDLFIDGTDIYADREKMGTIANEALEEAK